MDFLFICREAEENSILTNLEFATQAVNGGRSAAVLFTEEALLALSGCSFRWSPLLKGRVPRMVVSRQANALGVPFAAEWDARWTDAPKLLAYARERGVVLWRCPLWSQLLGFGAPSTPGGEGSAEALYELVDLEPMDLLQELERATTVVGGF